MALYDNNGKITIDEVAAEKDKNNLSTAIASLREAGTAIDRLIAQAQSTKGATGNAILEKATELKNQIRNMIGNLTESKDFITNTVIHYQRLDQQVKDVINSVKNGGIK